MIKKWLISIVREAVTDIPYKTRSEVLQGIFPFISNPRMKEFLVEMEEKGINGNSLAEMYSMMLRDNLEKRNDEAIHNYWELLPKLKSFERAFVNENIIKDIEDKYKIKHMVGAGKVFINKDKTKKCLK